MKLLPSIFSNFAVKGSEKRIDGQTDKIVVKQNWYMTATGKVYTVVFRREFTTAGVAAGVSAGFNAPIGGLLFAMEDLSSFWTKTLSWQTFFCCVIATITAQIFNIAFYGFNYEGQFGAFSVQVRHKNTSHIDILSL